MPRASQASCIQPGNRYLAEPNLKEAGVSDIDPHRERRDGRVCETRHRCFMFKRMGLLIRVNAVLYVP